MKKVRFRYLDKTRKEDIHNEADPTENELKTGKYIEKVIQIDEYGKNEILGADSLINEENFNYSGVTLIPTELIIINFEDLLQYITPEVKINMRAMLKTYPDE
jgi:hypothetical protein